MMNCIDDVFDVCEKCLCILFDFDFGKKNLLFVFMD